MEPVSSFHQLLAIPEWMCSGVARASQTFTSGKLNEVIDLVVRNADAASCGRD